MTNAIDRNVGTQGFPVSWLHERAVAILWQELRRSLFSNLFSNDSYVHTSRTREPRLRSQPLPLRVRTADGWSGDLCAGGVVRIDFPDDLTHIGGVIPDIALYNKDNRPIRIIEVVVTSSPDQKKQSKLDTLAARGIETVVVPVKTKHDLMEMVWDHDSPAGRDHPDTSANREILPLINALMNCSPSAKRAFLDALRVLKDSDVENLWPLAPDNPKLDVLGQPYVGQTL